MRINTRAVGEVTQLDLDGRLVWNEGTSALQDVVVDLIAHGRLRVALNLRGVPYVDSKGIAEIVLTHQELQRRGGSLSLVDPSPYTARLLKLTKLDAFLEVECSDTLWARG